MSHIILPRHGDGGHMDNGNLSNTDMGYMPTDEENNASRIGTEAWDASPKWGRYSSWVFLAILGLATLIHLWNRFYLYRNKRNSSPLNKLMAIYRYQAYLHPIEIRFRDLTLLRPPTLGSSILIVIYMSVTTGICFGIKPWYRVSANYGAPPLANRGEWFAMALVPWVFAMSAKVSPVTILTRISHDRLQVWHQWGARALLFFATIHGAPYIYQRATMWGVEGFDNWIADDYNWTGVASYVPLFWLVFSSFAPIRNSHYEWWVVYHILTAIIFLVFLFLHGHNLLDTNKYLWTTVGIMILGYLLRLIVTFRMSGFFRWPKARAEMISHDAIKLTIPSRTKWLPGSHVFVRFPTLNVLQAHPFSIASIPTQDGIQSVELIMGVRGGMTKKLMKRIQRSQGHINGAEFPVIIDGAFSGVDVNAINRHDEILLIAGGAGLTYVLPLLLTLIETPRNVKKVTLIWAVPSIDRMTWLDALHKSLTTCPLPFSLDLQIHITRESLSRSTTQLVDSLSKEQALVPSRTVSDSDDDKFAPDMEKGPNVKTTPLSSLGDIPGVHLTTSTGRPDLPDLVSSMEETATPSSSLGIAVCGPGEIGHLVGNATAKLQLRILTGRSNVREAVLYEEAFSW